MFGEDSRGGYLIAANNTANTVSVTFQLAGDVLAEPPQLRSASVPVSLRVATRHGAVHRRSYARTLTDTFSPYDVNVYRIYTLDSSVSIDLGSPDMADGMTHPQPIRRRHHSRGERERRQLQAQQRSRRGSPPDSFFYFGVSDQFAFQGNRPDLYITVRYYDPGAGSLELRYDAADSPYKSGGSGSLCGDQHLEAHTFHVTDAYFGNRQTGGADFRISGGSGTTFYLDNVTVSVYDPGSPTAIVSCDRNSGPLPVTVNFDATRSYDDGSIASYAWDFDNNGTTDAVGPTAQHVFTADGVVAVTLRVTDNQGLTDTKRVYVFAGSPPSSAPGAVSAFSASADQGVATLSWTNPADCDLAGVMIRGKGGSYPTSTSDGQLVCDKSATPGAADEYSYNVFDNVQYRYAAFAYDGLSHYSAPAYASASSCLPIWLNESFEPYALGNLGGQGSWITTGAASAQVVTNLPQSRAGRER